jgi:hypothetical protein
MPVAFFCVCLALAGGAADVEVTGSASAVQTGTTLDLWLAPALPPATTVVGWSASVGTIESGGDRAVYHAPEEPGTCLITVTLEDENGRFLRRAALTVFRQFVILKADDFGASSADRTRVNPNWIRYLDTMMARGVKTSAGVVGAAVSQFGPEAAGYARRAAESGLVEFFNHGWDHGSGTGAPPTLEAAETEAGKGTFPPDDPGEKADDWYEFLGTSSEYQSAHLQWCQDTVRSLLGVDMAAFGAPFNKADAVTAAALDAQTGLQVWLYPKGDSRLFPLRRGGGEIESPTGTPNFAAFLATYDPARPCVTLQLHPGTSHFWNAWGEMESILDTLEANQATFTLPLEHARLMRGEIQPTGTGMGSPFHSADSDTDGRISLSELLRVVQLYNHGGYHPANGSEDGFAPGTGAHTALPHAADCAPQDWTVGLSEFLRVAQLYSAKSYTPSSDSEDGFAPVY